jgi:tetratricopeptide (TPR) repeat protein
LDQTAGRVNLTQWNQAYGKDPGASYRSAPADIRLALDRQLWADGLEKLLESQAAEDTHAAVRLAARAESDLPDRPPLAASLLNRGLNAARENLESLRRDEVMALGQIYRDKLHNTQSALDLYRDWLKSKRDRLSETDADGPVALASLYEEMLQDRSAARELLERAWKIDPGSKEVTEAFRARGYQLVKDQWVEAGPTSAQAVRSTGDDGASRSAPPSSAVGLRGQSPDEVLRQIGSKPDRKALSGTKGQIIEQWIFQVPTRKQIHFVNFARSPGELQPRVVSDYFLPSTAIIGELKPAH